MYDWWGVGSGEGGGGSTVIVRSKQRFIMIYFVGSKLHTLEYKFSVSLPGKC